MTGIQLPTSPSDRRPDTDHPPATDHSSIAVDRAAPQAHAAGARSLQMVSLAVVVLAVVAAVLGVLLLLTASDRVQLEAENERLAAENAELLAANQERTADLRRWEEELYGWEEFQPGDPVALFAAGPVEELLVEGAARYVFDAEAGQLLELAVAGDGDGFFSLELADDEGRFFSFAELGSFPDGRFGGYGPSDQAWFVFERDGAYQLTIHAEGMFGPVEPPVPLSAQLHTPAAGLERVIDVNEAYPTDGEVPLHTFEGRAGQLAIITMTSERLEALDPFVRLYGPDGALIGQDDDGAGDLDARLVVRLPEDGTYEVEADVFDAGFTRRSSREHPYTLTVELAELT